MFLEISVYVSKKFSENIDFLGSKMKGKRFGYTLTILAVVLYIDFLWQQFKLSTVDLSSNYNQF